MLGVKPKRFGAAVATVLVAVAAATARADSAPGSYIGNGVSFSYPTDWLNLPGETLAQLGTPLWAEYFGPLPQAPTPPPGSPTPAPPAQPTQTIDLAVVAEYHIPVSITKKNIARYKGLVRYSTQVLLAQVGGKLLSGPKRVAMGKLPGYRIDALVTVMNTPAEDRVIVAFHGHYEYVLNCQNTQNGPLSTEIKSGCDQIMQTFRLVPVSN